MDLDNKQKEQLVENVVDLFVGYCKPILKKYLQSAFFPPVYKPMPHNFGFVSTMTQKKAKIEYGSTYVQNMTSKIWKPLDNKLNPLFDVSSYSDSENPGKSVKMLCAFGYGKGVGVEAYGSGPLYVEERFLIYETESIPNPISL